MARTAGSFGNSQHAVLGFAEHGEGRLAVYGDSNCLDSSHQRSSCYGLLLKAIKYVAEVRDIICKYTSLYSGHGYANTRRF